MSGRSGLRKHTSFSNTDDVRIRRLKPLIPPACLLDELPLQSEVEADILEARAAAERIVSGEDDRLLVIVGPCSIHDPKAAMEYTQLLKVAREKHAHDLHIVMRVYFEKPRTTVGWKGLINDPDLNGTFNINKGLRVARQLLLDINEAGVPAGCEFLDTISPQYVCDLVTWGAIGARTTESQCHRELASGVSCPVGFKNGTSGDFQVAVDGVRAAAHRHRFLSVTKDGIAAIVETNGNSGCHIILRGGKDGPNFGAEKVAAAAAVCEKSGLAPRLLIDCSHGNSNKDFRRQPIVASDVGQQVASGNRGIVGVMIESNINEGKQSLPPVSNGQSAPGDTCPSAEEVLSSLAYGTSVTDACISWTTTEEVLQGLAEAVQRRRSSA